MRKNSLLTKITVLIITGVMVFGTVFSSQTYHAFAASKPAKVSGVKATAISNYSIKVTWKKAKNAKQYQVYYSKKKKGNYKKIANVKGTSFINSDLKKGTTYYYKVRAINGKKTGAFSSVKAAKTLKSSLYDVTVDKSSKTVTISAKVNGKYFNESTRHFMVDQKGFNKGKAMLSSYCTPGDLYDGLVRAGGISWSKTAGKALKNGEKNTVANAENKNFSRLDITVSFDNKTFNLNDCVTTEKNSNKSPEIDMIFAANKSAAEKTPSGCMVCMDSCYIGIAANCAYGLCVIDHGNPTLFARPDVLPADGSIVKVTFKIK